MPQSWEAYAKLAKGTNVPAYNQPAPTVQADTGGPESNKRGRTQTASFAGQGQGQPLVPSWGQMFEQWLASVGNAGSPYNAPGMANVTSQAVINNPAYQGQAPTPLQSYVPGVAQFPGLATVQAQQQPQVPAFGFQTQPGLSSTQPNASTIPAYNPTGGLQAQQQLAQQQGIASTNVPAFNQTQADATAHAGTTNTAGAKAPSTATDVNTTPATTQPSILTSHQNPEANGILGDQGAQLPFRTGGYAPADIPEPADKTSTTTSGARYQDQYGNNQISGYYFNKNDGQYYPIGAYPDLATQGYWAKDQNGAWMWTGGTRGVANQVPNTNAWSGGGGGGSWGGYGSSGYNSKYGNSDWMTSMLNWRI